MLQRQFSSWDITAWDPKCDTQKDKKSADLHKFIYIFSFMKIGNWWRHPQYVLSAISLSLILFYFSRRRVVIKKKSIIYLVTLTISKALIFLPLARPAVDKLFIENFFLAAFFSLQVCHTWRQDYMKAPMEIHEIMGFYIRIIQLSYFRCCRWGWESLFRLFHPAASLRDWMGDFSTFISDDQAHGFH